LSFGCYIVSRTYICIHTRIRVSIFESRTKKGSRGIGKLQLNCTYYIWLCSVQRMGSTMLCVLRACARMFESFRVISGEWFIHLTTERRQWYKLRVQKTFAVRDSNSYICINVARCRAAKRFSVIPGRCSVRKFEVISLVCTNIFELLNGVRRWKCVM